MIHYPKLKEGATIGVTAPSSGVPEELHSILKQAIERREKDGFSFKLGETIWTQEKAKSASAKIRASEFNRIIRDENVDLIIPPWGGELLIEMLEGVDYDDFPEKWVLGYSDTSALLMAITLKTGMATAHGTNLLDIRGEFSDPVTGMWQEVLSTDTGETVQQVSSEKYQKEWQHENPTSCIFHLTEPTEWKTLPSQSVEVEGRLIGGCIDIVHHLAGTPYGDVEYFQKYYLDGEPLVWYFENCDMTTTDLRRSLVQMKYAGWFDNISGILFGRSPANAPVEDYNAEDVYRDLEAELGVPVISEIDCGHIPPQITFINGAHAKVQVKNGKGTVIQTYEP